jgi:NDP-sugar pyrophosphorylase family protein
MKILYPFIIILCAVALNIINSPQKFETVIEFQQTYSSGIVDTAFAVIETRDSLRYVYFYEKPTRYFPMGGWYFAEKYGVRPELRHYTNPQVVKVRPLRVTSKMKWK